MENTKETQKLRDDLRFLIKTKGVTQQEVALHIGMSQPAVSNFLRGYRGIGYDYGKKLSEYLAIHATTTPDPCSAPTVTAQP